MIKPEPFKLICPNCNYSKIVRPNSDKLDILDSLQHCPKCDTLLEKKLLSRLAIFVERIFG